MDILFPKLNYVLIAITRLILSMFIENTIYNFP